MPYPMSFREFARHYIDGAHALIALGSLPHLSVNKYSDPTEGERRNLNMDEVRDIAAADLSLLFVDYRTDEITITDVECGAHSLTVIVDGKSCEVDEEQAIDNLAAIAHALRNQKGE